ncbi:methyl-accepting chemotaxis protein [Dehalobacter sp. DCM]|uniref:methyl-accepting chemotaxis protein n=1 Tax=Dehalobacter sp. DCM TaxID=2907827 RepID=UPI0030817B00|nr:methyl-accepting chemotaxis protein [Dehalobacter sp. DCM]
MIIDLNNDQLLECYAEVFSQLKEILKEDLMVTISNKTHFLYYYPGNEMKFPPGENPVGQPLPPTGAFVHTVESGKCYFGIADKERFGFPFISITYPLKNRNGDRIGCLALGRSLKKENAIAEISHGLASTIEEMNAGLQEIASGSQGLSNKINYVVHSAQDTATRIKEINKVIDAITDISSHSNLLGLNAAIEAARAGEQGRGFAVVAEEMRILAAQSKDSAITVTQILTQMKESIEGIIADITDIGDIAGTQAAATEEMTAAIEEVTEKSQNLAELSTIKDATNS